MRATMCQRASRRDMGTRVGVALVETNEVDSPALIGSWDGTCGCRKRRQALDRWSSFGQPFAAEKAGRQMHGIGSRI
jgi:hypothetical protein